MIQEINAYTSPYLLGKPAVSTSAQTLTFATPVRTTFPSTAHKSGAPRSLHGPTVVSFSVSASASLSGNPTHISFVALNTKVASELSVHH